MKTMKRTSILAIAFLLIGMSVAFAQRGRNFSNQEAGFYRNHICNRVPDLTEDQEIKIEALRVDHLKEMNDYRNQMNELRARKQTMMSSDNANMSEINSVIDQMTAVHGKMMKASAKHRQDVRNQLTDQQKVYFDASPRNGRGNGQGYGRSGRGKGNYGSGGQGYGQAGYGQGYNRFNN
jgi:Spy/CpxP family protein refolding chaperone